VFELDTTRAGENEQVFQVYGQKNKPLKYSKRQFSISHVKATSMAAY
jgi:hypothetical protein